MADNLPPDLEKLHEAHNEKYQNLLKQSKGREEALRKELEAARVAINTSQNAPDMSVEL